VKNPCNGALPQSDVTTTCKVLSPAIVGDYTYDCPGHACGDPTWHILPTTPTPSQTGDVSVYVLGKIIGSDLKILVERDMEKIIDKEFDDAHEIRCKSNEATKDVECKIQRKR
jgi:hypothetical protein